MFSGTSSHVAQSSAARSSAAQSTAESVTANPGITQSHGRRADDCERLGTGRVISGAVT